MLLNFFQKVLDLKNVPRQGWKDKLQIDNVESVAEHTYSAAIMSMIYSDLHELNTEKIIKMALLHDLSESIIGDLTPDEISKKRFKTDRELSKKNKIRGCLTSEFDNKKNRK